MKLQALWAWVKANPKHSANIALILLVYGLSRTFPDAAHVLEAIGSILGIYGTRLQINAPASDAP